MTGKSAKDFFRPLAVGAPAPLREIPARPSRAIHFFDPSNEKMAAKVPDMVGTVDVLLGNLEDAVKAENKEKSRQGLVDIGKSTDFGKTQFWTRINSLDSPWVLDDLTTLVPEIGDKLDVIMVPKVQGAEDIHYVDRLLAQLEARAGLTRPILVHAILETASGVAHVEEIAGAGHRVLVFSQFTRFLDRTRDRLGRLGIAHCLLDGRTRDRAAVVDAFRTGVAPVFLISLKAGGLGLNLTAAEYVFLLDPWWNPAVEDQATDRTHRIGQTRAVFSYKLITKGTVEEKILELQRRKKELAAGVLGTEADVGKMLTEQDVEDLFRVS